MGEGVYFILGDKFSSPLFFCTLFLPFILILLIKCSLNFNDNNNKITSLWVYNINIMQIKLTLSIYIYFCHRCGCDSSLFPWWTCCMGSYITGICGTFHLCHAGFQLLLARYRWVHDSQELLDSCLFLGSFTQVLNVFLLLHSKPYFGIHSYAPMCFLIFILLIFHQFCM